MDNNLTNKTKQIIENEAYAINAEISSKLNQARQLALKTNKNKSFLFNSWLIPATALAAMLVYFLLPFTQVQEIHGESTTTNEYLVIEEIQNLDILEQYELVEDYEFYEWLSQEDETSSI